MSKTSNLKRSIVRKARKSEVCLQLLLSSLDEENCDYVNVQKMINATVECTPAKLQRAIEQAEQGLEVLKSFVELAKAEKARLETAQKVYTVV